MPLRAIAIQSNLAYTDDRHLLVKVVTVDVLFGINEHDGDICDLTLGVYPYTFVRRPRMLSTCVLRGPPPCLLPQHACWFGDAKF